jgi:hypothetical protein
MIITFLLWGFWVYITTESFICFWRMDNGDRLCRVLKYSLSALVPAIGLGLLYLKPDKVLIVLWLIPDVAIALFFWPTTYARFTGQFKNRIGD